MGKYRPRWVVGDRAAKGVNADFAFACGNVPDSICLVGIRAF